MSLYCSPITDNISKVCGPKKGGLIKNLYMANFGQLDSTTITTNEVTAITMKADPLTVWGANYIWFQLGVKKQTAGFTNPANIGDSKFFDQTLNFTIEGFDTATKLAFESMIDGEALFIGIDGNGVAHMMGRLSGAEMTEGSIGTGVATTDLIGGTATFVASEVEVMKTITAGTTISVLNEDGITVDVITL